MRMNDAAALLPAGGGSPASLLTLPVYVSVGNVRSVIGKVDCLQPAGGVTLSLIEAPTGTL